MKHRSVIPASVLLALTGHAGAQALLYSFEGGPGDRLGASVAGAGDVDGDGVDDVVVGMPSDATKGWKAGAARVYSGKDGSLLLELYGERSGDLFGTSVDGAGDIDGDGRAEVIVGAPGYDYAGGSSFNSGTAYVYTGSGVLLYRPGSASAGDNAGFSVAGLGDMDGDGLPEYAFGMPLSNYNGLFDQGAIVVMASSANWAWPWMVLWGGAAGDLFGWSLDSAGDIDQDGRDDLIVGAPLAEFLGTNQGKAYVISGRTKYRLFETTGGWNGGELGYDVAGIGDADQDGYPDFAIGEPFADFGGPGSGRVQVFSGKWPFPQLHADAGWPGSWFGFSVAGVGDFDGDGGDDLAIGAPQLDFGSYTNLGNVWVLSGDSGGFLWNWWGNASGDEFGYSVAGAGDMNLDGLGEVVAGAPYNDAGGKDPGQARVFAGGVRGF